MPILHEQNIEPWTSWKVLWKYLNNTDTKGSPLCDGLKTEDIWRRKKLQTAIKRNKKWRQIQEAYNLTLKPYPFWFFHNRHSYLLKNKSLGAGPPQTNLGFFPFSCWSIGFQCSSTSMFHTQNLAPNAFGLKIWSS
jgi:hypothetical protein